MKILGIGVDVIQNKRIKLLIKNKTFVKSLKSTSSRQYTIFERTH